MDKSFVVISNNKTRLTGLHFSNLVVSTTFIKVNLSFCKQKNPLRQSSYYCVLTYLNCLFKIIYEQNKVLQVFKNAEY